MKLHPKHQKFIAEIKAEKGLKTDDDAITHIIGEYHLLKNQLESILQNLNLHKTQFYGKIELED